MKRSIIAGIGHHVPERIVSNKDLEKIMDTTDEWITERTGIKERRWFDPDKDTVANMSTRASRMALERAGMDVKEVDFIVFATITPDYFFPGSGVLMQRELGLDGIGALDIRNACSGFVYGLSVADQFIRTGMYKNVLVVGAEIQSSGLDVSTRGRNTAVIFGDGAGAAVLRAAEEDSPEAEAKRGILSTHLHADGNYAEELYMKDPGSSRKERLTKEMLEGDSVRPHMNGNAVFKHATTRFQQVIKEALDTHGFSPPDIDLLIPHQANMRISEFVRAKLKLPEEKIYNNIQRYGNTTGASIPIALSEAWAEGRVKQGDLLCLAAFGAGFTWASALIRW